MASIADPRPAFASIIVHVSDVAKSIAFYGKAFGFNVRCLDESNRWGELESGRTTIAFTTSQQQQETDQSAGVVQTETPMSSLERQPVELCFAYPDVDAAYKVLNQRALKMVQRH